MTYEITIRELEPYTAEEESRSNRMMDNYTSNRFSDINFHEKRVTFAELTPEEFQAVKKAIIGVL